MTDREILEKLFYMVTGLKDDVASLEDRFNSLEDNVSSLNTKFDHLSADLNSVKLTIENEIRPNIKEIAACHLDLSKKLDAVTASYESYSDLQIRVRVLESQMREVRMAQ